MKIVNCKITDVILAKMHDKYTYHVQQFVLGLIYSKDIHYVREYKRE